MESDFIEMYAANRPHERDWLKAVYDDVIEDLVNELRGESVHPQHDEERSLRAVAVAAIRYARELTRDRNSTIFAARHLQAQSRLSSELWHWQKKREQEAAEWEAQRQAEREAQTRAKKEERRRRREAKKAKQGADGSSTPTQ
jgi:hypothetical protein